MPPAERVPKRRSRGTVPGGGPIAAVPCGQGDSPPPMARADVAETPPRDVRPCAPPGKPARFAPVGGMSRSDAGDCPRDTADAARPRWTRGQAPVHGRQGRAPGASGLLGAVRRGLVLGRLVLGEASQDRLARQDAEQAAVLDHDEALHLMVERGLDRVVVVEDGRLLGILPREPILRRLAEDEPRPDETPPDGS